MLELVDNDTFILRLKSLFEDSKDHGTVWLTHKRLTYGSEEDDATRDSLKDSEREDTTEYPCLLRASDGGKVKFSTRINPSDLPKFYAIYGTLLKSTLTLSLRKRDKKREKLRAEETMKKKKRMIEDVVVEGPKRGKGRRARQRKVKAKLRQEEGRKKWREREEAAVGKVLGAAGVGLDGVVS